MSDAAADPAAPRSARALLRTAPAAVVVGIGAGLLLVALDYLSGQLEHLLWDYLPDQLGFAGSSWWWRLVMLTAAGLAVGLVVRFVPGHAGPDQLPRD
jgi:H+/Cl- antiporter ClcA